MDIQELDLLTTQCVAGELDKSACLDLITKWGEVGRIGNSEKVFRKTRDMRDDDFYVKTIEARLEKEHYDKCIYYIKRMLRENYKPDPTLYDRTIELLAKHDEKIKIISLFDEIRNFEPELLSITYNTIIKTLAVVLKKDIKTNKIPRNSKPRIANELCNEFYYNKTERLRKLIDPKVRSTHNKHIFSKPLISVRCYKLRKALRKDYNSLHMKNLIKC